MSLPILIHNLGNVCSLFIDIGICLHWTNHHFLEQDRVFIYVKFIYLYYFAHRVIYYRDSRQDDVILQIASNIFGTTLANSLIFSFLISLKAFSLSLLTWVRVTFNKQFKHNQRKQTDSKRYVITETSLRLILSHSLTHNSSTTLSLAVCTTPWKCLLSPFVISYL